MLWTRNAPRSDARSEAIAKALGPGPDEVRPVLSLSKGREDDVEFRNVQKSIAPEGAPTVEFE